MRAQRAPVAGNGAEMQSIKWTAEGTVKGSSRVFRDVMTCVSGRRYVGILQSVCVFFHHKPRWHRESNFVLGSRWTVKAFFIIKNTKIQTLRKEKNDD